MGFPANLDNVAVLKIHPAIGIARLANNEDEYEFFASEVNRPAHEYMSVQNGKPTMMRQAVQFRIFAYDAAHQILGELTGDLMTALSIEATWSAKVANRKLHNYSKKKPGHPVVPEIAAQGSVKGDQRVALDGKNPWDATKTINLGHLSGRGLFSAPKGGVHRKFPGAPIPPWPANEDDSLDVADTTSDGSIEVALTGTAAALPVLPAWVVVAPQEHSPDVMAGDPNLFGATNLDWTAEAKRELDIAGDPPDTPASRLDRATVNTINGEYNPGMEVSFQPGRMEFASVNDAFYPRDAGFIGPDEIRVQLVGAGGASGALPGQLTSGLCSTWQGDLVACLDYWTAEYPNKVFREPDQQSVFLFRRDYTSTTRMSDPEDAVTRADEMGVARNLDNNVNKLHERERKP